MTDYVHHLPSPSPTYSVAESRFSFRVTVGLAVGWWFGYVCDPQFDAPTELMFRCGTLFDAPTDLIFRCGTLFEAVAWDCTPNLGYHLVAWDCTLSQVALVAWDCTLSQVGLVAWDCTLSQPVEVAWDCILG